jgi:RNA polymerase sigma-70 factor (ECF subfamily)
MPLGFNNAAKWEFALVDSRKIRQNDGRPQPMPEAVRPTLENNLSFESTHWSVVLAARGSSSTQANEAMARLCRAYWYPLYAHIRRRGYDAHAAEDLTQELFARLVEKRWLDDVDPAKGRFRSFLLAAADHLLANERRRTQAVKRGRGRPVVSLEGSRLGAERFALEGPSSGLPGRSFDRAWAMTVLDQALSRLQEELAGRGRMAHFEEWKIFLTREATLELCTESGRRLGLSPSAVGVGVHRLRERYGELLREIVAHTVRDPAEVDDELRYLFGLLNE